jgi:hypothetical protein
VRPVLLHRIGLRPCRQRLRLVVIVRRRGGRLNGRLRRGPHRLGTTQQRLELVERAAHIGRRRGCLCRRRSDQGRLETRLGPGPGGRLRCHWRGGTRLLGGAPGEELLQRIVLPDETGQLHQRIGGRTRLLRLGRSAQLTLQIIEIEAKRFLAGSLMT